MGESLLLYAKQIKASFTVEEHMSQNTRWEFGKENAKASEDYLESIMALGEAFAMQPDREEIPRVLHTCVGKWMAIDIIGIGILKQGKLVYKVYDAVEQYLEPDNDLVEYTKRLVEHSTQFLKDIEIQDGNFETYSIRTIKNSNNGIKLESMLVKALKIGDEVIGALAIGSYKKGVYQEKDCKMIEIIGRYVASRLKEMEMTEKMAYLKEHDCLTGTLERRMVLKKGELLFKANHKKHKSTVIMMLNVDLFKQMNRKYGQALGDEVLSQVGKLITTHIRKEDYVGRYGSKAFIVILNNLNEKEVKHIAQAIKSDLEDLTFETKKEKNIKATLSGGIYFCNEYTLNFEDAIRFADHALYRAKLLGKNHMLNYNFTIENKS